MSDEGASPLIDGAVFAALWCFRQIAKDSAGYDSAEGMARQMAADGKSADEICGALMRRFAVVIEFTDQPARGEDQKRAAWIERAWKLAQTQGGNEEAIQYAIKRANEAYDGMVRAGKSSVDAPLSGFQGLVPFGRSPDRKWTPDKLRMFEESLKERANRITAGDLAARLSGDRSSDPDDE